jgi:hypothetical protein
MAEGAFMTISVRPEGAPLAPAPPPLPTARGKDPAQPHVPSPPPAADAATPFAEVLVGLGREAERGEALMRGAVGATAAGRDLSTSELLALQAGIYRYSEVIDLSAKLVDRASNAVRTVLSGQ